MKPLLILLVVLLLAGCSARSNTNAAKAVCTTVANCCRSAKSVSAKSCEEKAPSTGDQLFSASLHELSKEILTW